MAKTLANYDPLVQIPSGMTPAGADFPIVESHDILVGENDKRLDAKLDDIDSAIGNVGQTPIATQLSSKVNTGDIVTSVAATGSTSNNKIPSETAVRAAIEAKTINVDSTVTQGSTNAVSGGAVHTQLATKQDTLTFDTTPTASSSNPVTSGGVKAALDAKQDALTFDTTPTASSSNPVTSGGVKAALDNKQNTLTYETTPIAGSVNPVTSTGIRNAIDAAAAQNLGAMQAAYAEFVADADAVLDRASSLSNGMVACSNIVAETTVGDTRILLYTGTTNANYTNGHWYYNSAPSNAAPSWTDGGAVGSAPTIDNTLTTAGAAADSKSVGDAIENIVTISNTQPGSNSGNKVWIRETTSEEVQVPTYAEHIAKANKADITTNNESDNGSGTITASKAYVIGDHFYINNTNTSSENYGVSTLYKATAAIASGGAIVVGTNCEASKVADEITSLSNDIDTVKADLGDMTISESENIFSYEQGNIRTTSGTTFDADNRVRFAAAYALPAGAMKVFEITVADGYKASVREYKNTNGTGFNGYADWVSGTSTYKPKSDTKSVKCVVAADDDSDITPSGLPSGVLTLKFRFATDKTLTQADKAADAKTVGDTFDDIRTSNEQTVTAWLQGSISNENGGNRSAQNRCRSLGYYHNEQTSAINLTIKSGYKLTARSYDSDDIVSPASRFVGNPLGETFVTGQQTMQVNPLYYYRFVIASNDDADITPSEVPADALTIAFSSWTDKTLTKANKAADAKAVDIELSKRLLMPDIASSQLLGNVSIAAAKTINFSDGTPPHVDWYLLMDTANRFYISKDLIHKKYLFTFTPPSASVPDWSVGIDGNNNVFFLKDAAGYTNDDGARLDDNKRVNPVYYLSEEGYNEMHTLDFGEEFKPAGWLGNVGWCVLPDGDIILCEYTRGTLKTCNVWHVDGSNITDPESWTVTWSHDIIDATDAITSGMKHCHEVMYDFYTDICYFGTGDSDDGSYNYYSTDHGLTWTLLYGPDKDRCRRLNFIFAPDKVYWASDSYESANHHFFIADRDAGTGVVDVENATEVALGWYNNESCYGCVYMPAENLIVFMDRIDREGSTIYDLIFKGYDLVSNSIVTLTTVPHTGSDKHAGFRCKYVEWYAIGNTIICGFSPASASVNSNTNQNAVCGNLGGTTGDGSERINNLRIHIYRKPDNTFFVRFDTVYC